MENKNNKLDWLLPVGFLLLILSGFYALLAPAKAQTTPSSTTKIFYTEPNPVILTTTDYIQRINYLEKQLSRYAQKLDTCSLRTTSIRTRN